MQYDHTWFITANKSPIIQAFCKIQIIDVTMQKVLIYFNIKEHKKEWIHSKVSKSQ